MNESQLLVALFMAKVGQDTPTKPHIPSKEIQELRLKLHNEEAYIELALAFEENDIIAVADSIADSLVVILGTAVACGIQIEPFFNEVMRSNFTKCIDGHRREDGKWMKGPSYKEPNLEPILVKQLL